MMFVLGVAVVGSAAAQTPATGGDPVAGRAKTQMCAGCHGIEGWRTAFPEVYPVPRIAGQHESYLVKALNAYRNGDRQHPSMRAIAATLVGPGHRQSRRLLRALGHEGGRKMTTTLYRNRIVRIGAAALIAAFVAAPAAFAADAEKGRAKAKEVCFACHLENGNSMVADFPRLGGQHADYLAKALRDYKSGKRKNPIMNVIVRELTKDDIANLALHYSSQTAVLASKH